LREYKKSSASGSEDRAHLQRAKAVEKALLGDSTMLRALLSTLVPPRRERTVEFELPKIESAADARKASSAVITACAAGELSPHVGKEQLEANSPEDNEELRPARSWG
jgi:hypothetical protein